jgi:hypothetical protein
MSKRYYRKKAILGLKTYVIAFFLMYFGFIAFLFILYGFAFYPDDPNPGNSLVQLVLVSIGLFIVLFGAFISDFFRRGR